ncbi:MAG: sugar ABC transporter substrate-binding protein [Clostridiaceae bacterium]|nr:sugar ABC transporter substrate-binding protein [Clostridiaceae bacterium]
MKRKLLSFILVLTMVVALAGCGSTKTETAPTKKPTPVGEKVGVAMPTKDLQRWMLDGFYMKEHLEKAGYEVDLHFAADDIPTQVSQIKNMINGGCKVLVIASIDPDSIGTVLDQAKEKNIKVIAYDRLIMNSDAVNYYVTFDNYKIGVKQGEYIEEKLGLKDGNGPFNMEIFADDPYDSNGKFFYNGAMGVLQKYIDSGKLVVKSGQVDFTIVGTPNFSPEYVQSRMEDIISANYTGAGANLDAVLCTRDILAMGVTNALEAKYRGSVYPIITGQDCEKESVNNILADKQAMSVTKITSISASKVVEMIDAIMKGEEVPVNDTETFDNGKGVVPSYLCEPVVVEKSNYKEMLIDTGYYTEDDLK